MEQSLQGAVRTNRFAPAYVTFLCTVRGCRRFRDPTPEEINALTLEGMREAVMNMLHPENVEVNITGDFDPAELKKLALMYLGTVSPRPHPPMVSSRPAQLVQPQSPVRIQWHLKDSDERACAYIAGKAPARWFSFGTATPNSPVTAPLVLPRNTNPQQVEQARDIRRQHPLYPMVTLNLLTEIINGRLFTTVRDSLGLTYDVSFEIASFDRLGGGWFVVNVTSTPNKIQQAMDASLRVLRNTLTDRVTSREVLRARRTVLTRHESDLKVSLHGLLLPSCPPVDVPFPLCGPTAWCFHLQHLLLPCSEGFPALFLLFTTDIVDGVCCTRVALGMPKPQTMLLTMQHP